MVAGNNPKPVSKPQQQSETIPRAFALNALYGNDKEKDTRFVGRDADIHQKLAIMILEEY
ncbi:MAG: hypothetical protein HC773_25070 [Scytonema sp. CRU_2_7]|nr:hypothetical protein [Scytonema sp. CRU_2_7]